MSMLLKNYDEAIVGCIANGVIDYSTDSAISKFTKLVRYIKDIGKYSVISEIPNQLKGDNVPVIFAYPMAEYQANVYPNIYIERSDISKNLSRWNGYYTTQYEVPSADAIPIGEDSNGNIIYNKYTKQRLPIPFDISYSINICGYYRNQVVDILNDLLTKCFAVNGILLVFDDSGDRRIYDLYIDRISENVDYTEVGNRKIIATIDIKVEGEFDYGVYDINEKWDEVKVINRILNVSNMLI